MALTVSVATLWVFSEDLEIFDPTLEYGFFHEDLAFFYVFFSKTLGFSGIFPNFILAGFVSKSKELVVVICSFGGKQG